MDCTETMRVLGSAVATSVQAKNDLISLIKAMAFKKIKVCVWECIEYMGRFGMERPGQAYFIAW